MLACALKMPFFETSLRRHAVLAQGGLIFFLSKIAIPGANGRPLRDRPLLRGLATGADNAPDFLPPTRRQQGFQMGIGAPAGKAGADGMRIKLFHGRKNSSFAAASQERAPLALRRRALTLC